MGSADGSGAAARFSGISDVVLDGAGNLFAADTGSHTVRKIVVATGAVTTLAGSPGVSGSTNGTGAAARFASPKDLAVDRAGNVFVSDSGNHLLRKIVASTGEVTTLAGALSKSGSADGSGAAARFNSPLGAVADNVGNLFVADSGNSTIRQVVLATGVVTTLAGAAGQTGKVDGTGAAARFNQPAGIAWDGAGKLFVADTNNAAIRQVMVATGEVSTVATSAAAYGIVADRSGNLFISDGYSMINKVVVATGQVTTLAGSATGFGRVDGTGAAASFGNPRGLRLDAAGSLFVADSYFSSIRKVVVATGEVTTVAGTANSAGAQDGPAAGASFYNPDDVALDGAGNLFIADYLNSTVRKIQLASATVSTVVGFAGRVGVRLGELPAGLNYPAALVSLGSGGIIILDENSVLWAH